MREWLGKMLYGVVDVWRNIGISQRVSIMIIMFLTLLALGGVLYVGSRPDFVVLYSNMNNETAQQVIELVESEGVEFQSRDNGRTILVPRKHASLLKARARAEGVQVDNDPAGWNLFNESELGMSQEQLRIKKQRAKQGEIERMLSTVPGVKHAKVELATPQRRAFYRKGQDNQPSASVLLVMNPGRMLTPQQVTTVRHQVAAAVEGLLPESVTVSDSHGRLLARRRSPDGDADPDSQLEIKEQIELQLQEKAEAILRPFVGASNVIAMVTADLDFDRVDIVKESYDSANKTSIMEKVTTEENTKQGASPSGVAGASSNLVPVKDPKMASAAKGETSQKTTKTSESSYVVPKITERKKLNGARIKSISVAVSIAQQGEEATPPEVLTKYKGLVMSAVGAVSNGDRQDKVEVVEKAFAPPVTDLGPSIPVTDRLFDMGEKVFTSPVIRIVFALMLLGILYKIFKSQFTSADVTQAEVQSGIYGEDLYLPPAQQARQLESGVQEDSQPETPVEFVKDRSERNPALIAQAIETWLRREEG